MEPFNAALQAMMDDGFMDQVNTKFWGDFAITYDDIEEVTYDD